MDSKECPEVTLKKTVVFLLLLDCFLSKMLVPREQIRSRTPLQCVWFVNPKAPTKSTNAAFAGYWGVS